MVLIPDNPQKNEFFLAFTDYQEHSLQTTREITDRYLESQKEILKSFHSSFFIFCVIVIKRGTMPRD